MNVMCRLLTDHRAVTMCATMLALALPMRATAGGPPATASPAHEASSASELVKWERFDVGMARAAKEKKPVVIDFYTSWCGWCKRMDATTYVDPEVVKMLGDKIVPIKVDAGSSAAMPWKGKTITEQQVAASYKVSGYPTIAYLDPAGKLVRISPGYASAPQMLPVLKYLGDGWSDQLTFEEYMRSEQLLSTQH